MNGLIPPNSGGDINYSPTEAAMGKMLRMPTLKERLDLAVTQAEMRLADAKEARALLDRNPDLERLLDIMQKGHF